jgi:transposase
MIHGNRPGVAVEAACPLAAIGRIDPMDQQTGTQDRVRRFQGGRPWIRRTVCMPALVAARFNPDMKRTYDTLIGRGRRQKVSPAAIMRKPVTLANALIWRREPWSPRYS